MPGGNRTRTGDTTRIMRLTNTTSEMGPFSASSCVDEVQSIYASLIATLSF